MTDSVPVETRVAEDRRESRVLDFVEVAAAALREQPPRLTVVD